jgi:CRP-like cAMP-binding protein
MHEDLEHLGEPSEPSPLSGQVDPAEEDIRSRDEALSTLGSAELFGALEEAQRNRLVQSVELVDLAAGENLFQQGDLADSMYVVAIGEVIAVATEAEANERVELARLKSGQFFGEIGLLSNQPRQAGIVAAEETSLLKFPRDAIMALVEEDPRFLRSLMRFLRMRLVETLMLTSPLFLPFGPEDRATLQRLFRFLEVDVGTQVVVEGERSDGLYVLVTGEAAAVCGPDETLLGLLGPGDVFGEMSLLQQKPAVASVVIQDKAFVLRLPDRYFMEVLMMHPALMEYVATLGATRAEQNAVLLKQADRVLDDHVALF